MKPIPIGNQAGAVDVRVAIAFAVAMLIVLICGCSRQAATADGGVSSRSVDSRGVGQIDEPPATRANQFGVYNALIIGIDHYSSWPRLKFAEADAQRIGDLLTQEYGFEKKRVTRLIGAEATRKEMMLRLRQKLEDMTEKDNLLIYYAGHGQIDQLTKTGFWIPADGDLVDESTWIPFSTIVDFLRAEGVRAKNIIVLTDSCYGGALANTKGGVTPDLPAPDPRNINRYVDELAKRAAKRSRQVLASGGYEEVPDKSLFAELLERALQKNEFPAIDLELLFYQNVYPSIRVNTQQEPMLSRIPSGPDIDGQFVLLRSNGSAVVETGNDGAGEVGTRSVVNEGGSATPKHDEPSPTHGTPPKHDPPPPPKSADPHIVAFSVSPQSVREGEKITISWDTSDADKVDISDIGSVPLSGSKQIAADFSKTYRIRAIGSDGQSVTLSEAVEVKASLPSIEYFRASSRSVKAGESVSVEWSVDNAVSVELALVGTDRTIMDVPAKGRRDLQPRESASLVLTAYNKDKERVGEKLPLEVAAADPPAPTPLPTAPTAPGGVLVADGGGGKRGGAGAAVGGAMAGGVRAVRPEILARAATIADACASGLVWREAFSGDHVCVAPAFRDQVRSDNAHAAERVNPRGAYGPNTCVNGYVWREARANDYVCVVPDIRTQVKQQNAAAHR